MNRIAAAAKRRRDIVAFMQENKRTTGAELAKRFGVSQRAIYRDMAALRVKGAGIAGFAGDGYVLLPPPPGKLLSPSAAADSAAPT